MVVPVVLLAGAVTSWGQSSAPPPELSPQPAALASLAATDRAPTLQVFVPDSAGAPAQLGKKGDAFTFDPATKAWNLQADWGSASVVLASTSDRVDATLRITNGGSDKLTRIRATLMPFTLSEPATGPGWKDGKGPNHETVGRPGVVIGKWSKGAFALCLDSEDVDAKLTVSRAGPAPKKGEEDAGPVQYACVVDTMLYNTDEDLSIEPGQTRELKLSLRVGKPGGGLPELAPDHLERFRKKHPPILNWTDRRPIGRVFMSSVHQQHKSATNPRGWFNEPKIDITTEAGLQAFRKRLQDRARGTVNITKKVGGQGVIVWDLEGQEFPHATSYIGDPRVLKEFAPEMDQFADEFFKVMVDGGIRVGVCIRPSIPTIHEPGEPGQRKARQGNLGFDIVDNLSDKIEYAKKRWGCTLFYMDTNVEWYRDRAGKMQSRLLLPERIHELARRHPDVLIVPEFARPSYFGAVAVYGELREHGFGHIAGTSPDIIELYPDAFRVVSIHEGKIQERWDELVRNVKRGDVLFFDAWYDPPVNRTVEAIYRGDASPPAAKK
jgi:hypothetical protein